MVSLWQHIVTAVTQLHAKVRAEQHGRVPDGIVTTHLVLIFLFVCG